MKNNGGKIRIILRRAQADASIINVPILLYFLIKDTGWLWWYSIILIVGILYRIYDTKVIFGQEWDAIFTKSKVFRELINDVKQIKSNMAKTE